MALNKQLNTKDNLKRQSKIMDSQETKEGKEYSTECLNIILAFKEYSLFFIRVCI